MLWLAIVIAIILISLIVTAFAASEDPAVALLAVGVGAIAVTITSFFFMIHQVNAGHVGVVYSFGKIEGQTGEGIVWTAPWKNVRAVNVQVQAKKFEQLGAASIETQDVFFDVTLNYSISPDKVQNLYRTVGPNYFEKLVEGRIRQILKDETVQYTAISVTQKRDEIRSAVAERLGTELSPYSITVVALTIDNIAYSEAFNNAIEQKQVATQDALREQERVKQSEYQAQQKAAEAKGDADAIKIRASAQAEANTTLSNSLTDKIIQYEAVRSLSDNIQIALIPSGQGIIIDPTSILQPR